MKIMLWVNKNATDKTFSRDCTGMTGIFDVKFVHLTLHDLFLWHHNAKNFASQCENAAKTNH